MQSEQNSVSCLIRLESVKAAAKVATSHDDVGNILIHAKWLATYIATGNDPEISNQES